MALSLSIIIPVYNEPHWISRCISSVVEAVDQAGIEAFEILVVDDGSTDRTPEILEELRGRHSALRVLAQPNQGRFRARQRGVEEAQYPCLLLIDARVTISPGSLRFVRQVMEEDPARCVWNAHCDIDTEGNAYAQFWNVLTEIAFADYLTNPRTTSFGPEEFDRFPKGTTCFLVPRQVWRDAMAHFHSLYLSLGHANDDTTLIRSIAQKHRIQISPAFRCLYRSRTTFRKFIGHIFHRGFVFVDGYHSPKTRFFPILLGFYPASIAFLAGAVERPLLVPLAFLALSVAGVGVALYHRRSLKHLGIFAALIPVYGVFFGMGLWAGLYLGLRDRLRRRKVQGENLHALKS